VIYTWLDDFAVWARKRFGPSTLQSAANGSATEAGTGAKTHDPV